MMPTNSSIEQKLWSLLRSFREYYRCDYRKFADSLLRAYDNDLQGLQPLDKRLVKGLADLISTLKYVRKHTLDEMRNFVERYKNDYEYIYVVDCLGLPDLYALMCSVDESKFNVIMRIFINQRTNTQAFKDAFASETMADAARTLGGLVIRILDTSLHEIEEKTNNGELNRNEVLNIIVGRMKYVSSLLAPHMMIKTMIVTDHGYDVMRRGSGYIINHVFPSNIRPALAKLAPVILLK